MIIGLYSRAPRMGKGTAAAVMANYGFKVLPLAGCLKGMVAFLCEYTGMSAEEVYERTYGDAKDDEIEILGVTNRKLQRTLGTEWGRKLISPDIWATIWKLACDNALQTHRGVVCDDVRFLNEANLMKELGGEVWDIWRPDKMVHTDHESDDALSLAYNFDQRLINDGTTAEFVAKVHDILDTRNYTISNISNEKDSEHG